MKGDMRRYEKEITFSGDDARVTGVRWDAL